MPLPSSLYTIEKTQSAYRGTNIEVPNILQALLDTLTICRAPTAVKAMTNFGVKFLGVI